ncbi:DUF499 domain-containing protein [Micromonospora chalcea]
MSLTPWWEALAIRPEILNASGAIDDVQMSLFQAVYGKGADRPPYAKADFYGEITYPTGQLVDLLAKVAVRLGSDNYTAAPALRRLDQGMGGGKSHACIGCWHLAAHPAELAQTEIGKQVMATAAEIAGKPLPADLGNPHVVVLPCDNMTPGAPDRSLDGPAITLYERFLWRLFDHDYPKYEEYQPYFNDKSKIGNALRSLNRPILIIIDEVLDYVGNGLDGAAKPDLTAQDMAFLRALLDTVNDVPHVATLVVMIASEKDTTALSSDGDKRREDLHALLERNGKPATVNENVDFSAILRRRLFVEPPAREIIKDTAEEFSKVMQNRAWKTKVFEGLSAPWVSQFGDEVSRTYPFHPQLMHLAEHEWANMAGFQKVRSTIRVFAATVYAHYKRAKAGEWVPHLIGPGDLPLSDANVRESILGSGLINDTKTQANYRSIAQNDIVGLDDVTGSARLLDRNRDDALLGDVNPRAAERAATMIFLASVVGSRGAGRRGASEQEVKAATVVPTPAYGLAHADSAVKELTDSDAGLGTVEILAGKGGQPPRYFLSTTQTLTILVRASKNTVSDDERDDAIARIAEEQANSGVFKKKQFIPRSRNKSITPKDVLTSAGIDDARTTRLIVLDPAQFSLRNGMEKDTMAAIKAVMGIGEDRLPVEWAASAVFAVMNTQRRQQARSLAVNYLAHQAALTAPEMEHNPDMQMAAAKARDDAQRALKEKIRTGFQHIVYLSQPEPHMPRTLAVETFDNDLQTALDGTTVWKVLVDKDRAFDKDQLTGPVLLLNLRDEDYGRPLNEVRDSFWGAPRLPLLPGGEDDLRRAIYQAVTANLLRLVDAADNDVTVTNPSEINLSQSGLRLAKPRPSQDGRSTGGTSDTETNKETDDSGPGGTTTKTQNGTTDSTSAPGAGEPGTREGPAAAEKVVTFTIATPTSDAAASDGLAQVFLQLYEILDAGSASWAQGTLTFIVDDTKSDGLVQSLKAMGISPVVRDQ